MSNMNTYIIIISEKDCDQQVKKKLHNLNKYNNKK